MEKVLYGQEKNEKMGLRMWYIKRMNVDHHLMNWTHKRVEEDS
jgi:hypothetical protein